MLGRRLFAFFMLAGIPTLAFAHSPWGQYQVYRQKHLLILSSRDDEPSYPFSKILADYLAAAVPSSKARPARAINIKRVYNLLLTNQFQFVLLSRDKIDMMRKAVGEFIDHEKVDLRTVYIFGELEFAVRADFPEELVAIVTHGIMESLSKLPQASKVKKVINSKYLHPGSLKALK